MANLIKRLFANWRSTSANKDQIDTLLQEGYGCHAASRYVEAQKIYSKILRMDPKNVDAQYLLGRLHGQQGNYQEAQLFLKKAITLKPDFADAYADLGNVMQLSGEKEQAKDYYLKALIHKPANLLALNNLSSLLLDSQQWDEAAHYLKKLIALQPDFKDAVKQFVYVCHKTDQLNNALPVLYEVIEINPAHAEAYAGLGFVFLKTFKPAQALPFFQRALELNPTNNEVQGNIAIALQDLGKLDEAIAAYDKALELNPQNLVARWHRSLVLLLRGEFKKAWPDYELRWLNKDLPKRDFPYPRWDGSDLKDKIILVYAEQGIGDEMMFASCLPDLIAKAKHCVIDCNPKLTALFERSFPTATVHGGTQFESSSWLINMMPIDVQIPIGSLPLHFRNALNDFPQHLGYLKADKKKTEYWQEKLKNLGAGLKIGFSWRGGTRISRREVRSLSIEDCFPILKQNGAHFINLQYDYEESEVLNFSNEYGIKIHTWPEAIKDYDETAALVNGLDLVISVCTAVIHLGGALGRPVWVMAPATPEWRYMQYSDTLPWYPSVKVFRQTLLGDWKGVTEKIAKELSDLTFK